MAKTHLINHLHLVGLGLCFDAALAELAAAFPNLARVEINVRTFSFGRFSTKGKQYPTDAFNEVEGRVKLVLKAHVQCVDFLWKGFAGKG